MFLHFSFHTALVFPLPTDSKRQTVRDTAHTTKCRITHKFIRQLVVLGQHYFSLFLNFILVFYYNILSKNKIKFYIFPYFSLFLKPKYLSKSSFSSEHRKFSKPFFRRTFKIILFPRESCKRKALGMQCMIRQNQFLPLFFT